VNGGKLARRRADVPVNGFGKLQFCSFRNTQLFSTTSQRRRPIISTQATAMKKEELARDISAKTVSGVPDDGSTPFFLRWDHKRTILQHVEPDGKTL
jgi:hypothetical protein